MWHHMILGLLVVSSVTGEFEVDIFDSKDNIVTGGQINAWIGDYIYCKYKGDDVIDPIYYGWVKVEENKLVKTVGPNFVSFPNEEDGTNRLYYGKVFGNGLPVKYRCVATDEDPYENRDDYTGAVITFAVSEPPVAGFMFKPRDYAALTDQPLDMLCERKDSRARVVWETMDQSQTVLDTIYDSDDPETLPGEFYDLINIEEDPDDFTMRIIVNDVTAIFTRCKVTYNALTDVESIAMIYNVAVADQCSAEGLGDPSNDVGDIITFRGCEGSVSYNEAAGITNDIHLLTFWQTAGGSFMNDIEETRALDGESTYEIRATTETERFTYHCSIQVFREAVSTIRASIESACQTFSLNVADNTLSFRVYYGEKQVIDFDTLDQRKTEIIPGADMVCELDIKPDMADDDTLFIYVREPGEDEYVSTGSNIVPADDVQVGASYYCTYTDASGENTASSGTVHVITGIVPTLIYDSSGQLLDTTTIYDIPSGDFIECRSQTPINPDNKPKFLWHRSIQVQNVNGPNQIRFGNTDADSNRFPINYGFGLGEPIGYQCIGTDDITNGQIAMMGTLVRFRAGITDPTKAGFAFTPADKVGFQDEVVTLSCTKTNDASIVIFETFREDQDPIQVIYNSDNGEDPTADGYSIDTSIQNTYILEITISEATAISTRCRITHDTLDDVESSAMIFMIELQDQCDSSESLDGVDVGTESTLSGCDVTVTISQDAGTLGSVYTAMTYWQQSSEAFPNKYKVVDESRTLDGQSIYDVKALPETHTNIYTCGVQIHRESELIIPATKNNLCSDEYPVNVVDNSVGFRIYYGNRDDMDDNDYIRFDTLNTYQTGFRANANLTCEIDRRPSIAPEDGVILQTMEAGSNDWVDHDDHIIDAASISITRQYRCVYRDSDNGDNDRESGVINFLTMVVDTRLEDRFGNEFTDGQTFDLTVGDYVVCVPNEPYNERYPPKYTWRRTIQVQNDAGPKYLRYKNEEDHSNRLYISEDLGGAEEVEYACVGTDDLSAVQDFAGTPIRFKAIPVAGVAGSGFEKTDHVGVEGHIVSLTCTRDADSTRVVWETINADQERQLLIADTKEEIEPEPESEYELTQNGNEFILNVAISINTAIFTRCVMSESGKEEVQATTMIYMIELPSSGCEASNIAPNLDVGEEVTFSGCSATTAISPATGENFPDFTTIAFWQRSDSESGPFVDIDETRTIEGESVYNLAATVESDQMYYTCGIQVHREQTLVVAGVASNVCGTPYHINVNADTVGFRLYYVEESISDPNSYIRFDTLDRYTTEFRGNNYDLICETDTKPEPGNGDDFFIEYIRSDESQWSTTNSKIVTGDQIQAGAKYRCAYYYNGNSHPDPADAASGTVFFVNVLVDVAIYDNDGEEIDSSTVYSLNEGDFLRCQALDLFYDEYPPRFLWRRTIDFPNQNGPMQIRFQNTQEQYNRLPISLLLGGGEDIGYRCIGADRLPEGLQDFMGKLVKFNVVASSGSETAGTVFDSQEQVAFVDDTVSLACSKANTQGTLIWEQVKGDTVVVIYNSADGGDPIDGYEITGDEDLDFTLEITVTQATSVVTRCTVSQTSLLTVTASTMVYAIERIAEMPCGTDATNNPQLGDKIELSGCEARVLVATDSEVTIDDYQAVFYWTQKLASEDEYVMIEESRALEKESKHTIEALSELNSATWQCAMQISRPQILTVSNSINGICTEELTLTIPDDSERFRIYYGNPDKWEYEEFLDLPASAVDVAKTNDGELRCEVDTHPIDGDDSWVMEEREGIEGDFTRRENNIVPAGQVTIGWQYRCVFTDDSQNEEVLSPIIRIVEGLNLLADVMIYNSAGQLLEEDQVYEINEGDYLECRNTEDQVTKVDYVWVRSLSSNEPGPNIIQMPNELESGFNRLFVHPNFGNGEEVVYRCIGGTNFGWGFTEFMGYGVHFKVIISDDPPPVEDGATGVVAGVLPLFISLVAYLQMR